jgi:hypothetical protein
MKLRDHKAINWPPANWAGPGPSPDDLDKKNLTNVEDTTEGLRLETECDSQNQQRKDV